MFDILSVSQYIQNMPPDTQPQVILIHYNEIALKGKNRIWFEDKLVENIRVSLKQVGEYKVIKEWGRILIENIESTISNTKKISNIQYQIINKLKNIFGIAYFCPAQIVKTNIKKIQQKSLELAQIAQFRTFRVSTKRCWKQFDMTSGDINRAVAGIILKNIPDKQVDLKNFDLNIQIELSQDKTLIYSEKIQGAGGLPLGTGGHFLSLLSGGIDSPVASYSMMKRGSQVDFIHYSSHPFIDVKSEDKVIRLAKLIANFENLSKFHLIRFGNIQKKIVSLCDPRYRILIYRSLMLKIAEYVAMENNYQALITGESLGQVASQTIENLTATSQDIKIPILRPLIALDKQDIVKIAQRIDTYQTSIQPHQDCCSMFAPINPITKAKPKKLQHELDKLNLKNILDSIEIKTIQLTPNTHPCLFSKNILL